MLFLCVLFLLMCPVYPQTKPDIPPGTGVMVLSSKLPTNFAPLPPYTVARPYVSNPVIIPGQPRVGRVRLLTRINLRFLVGFTSQGKEKLEVPVAPAQQPVVWELLKNGRVVFQVPFNELPLGMVIPKGSFSGSINSAHLWEGTLSTDPLNQIFLENGDILQWRYSTTYVGQPEAKNEGTNLVIIRFYMNRVINPDTNFAAGTVVEVSEGMSTIQYREEGIQE